MREQEKRDKNQINLLIYGPVDLSRHFFPTYRSERIRIYVLITVSQRPGSDRPSLFRHEFLINKASSWHIEPSGVIWWRDVPSPKLSAPRLSSRETLPYLLVETPISLFVPRPRYEIFPAFRSHCI